MAWETGPCVKIPGLTAGADLSAAANQYKFVEVSTTKTVTICNAATDRPIGVLQNRPLSGQPAEVVAVGITKLQADAALTVGAIIGTSADGQADVKVPGTDITEYIVGTILEAAGAAGEYATAIINCPSAGRGA